MEKSLHTLLQQKIVSIGSDQALRAIGYSVQRLPAARERLRSVLKDPWVGLASAHYDFRFGSREFVTVLAEVVGLDSDLVVEQLAGIEVEIERERQAFKPWIFVETGFTRTSEPIIALAALEGKRRLALEKDSWRLPRAEIVANARASVRAHYRQCHGELSLWGRILEYWLILSDTEQVVLDVTGKEVRVEPPKSPRREFWFRLK